MQEKVVGTNIEVHHHILLQQMVFHGILTVHEDTILFNKQGDHL